VEGRYSIISIPSLMKIWRSFKSYFRYIVGTNDMTLMSEMAIHRHDSLKWQAETKIAGQAESVTSFVDTRGVGNYIYVLGTHSSSSSGTLASNGFIFLAIRPPFPVK
jgi:hypothetical protein